MQLRIVSLVVLLAGAGAVHVASETSEATAMAARAEAWMRDNPDPDSAGMDDLKNSDPNAYAIVSALLMKQQVGLLDPANPTGKRPEAEHESAADIMRDAPTIQGTEGMAMSEMAIKAPVRQAALTHDPWAFKPHDDDEAMVSNVLGAVSGLTGSSMPSAPRAPSMPSSSLLSSRRSTESALNADMDLVGMAGSASDLGSSAGQEQANSGNYYGISMEWGKKPQASMSQQNSYVAPAQPSEPVMNRANPYLEGIDLGNQPASMAPKPAASLVKQRSYLESISFPGTEVKPAEAPMAKGSNDLMGFSWGDLSGVASGAVQVNRPVETQYMQVVEDKVDQSKLKGALSDWLAPAAPSTNAVAHRRAQQAQHDEQPGEKVDPMAIDNYNNWAHSGAFQ
jgi:hypothetical protein